MQHLYAIRQAALCDLYRDEPEASQARLAEVWSRLRRSNLLYVPLVRIDALALRGRLALAVAARRGPGSGDLRDVDRAARRLLRERRSDARVHGLLLRAGASALRGDSGAAQAALRTAAAEADSAGMALYAEVARHRAGELLGGAEGQALIDPALAALRNRGVQEPARWAALVAPGAWTQRSRTARRAISYSD
jgi:hypothetical protein